MPIRDVRIGSDPLLRKRSKEVKEITKSIVDLLDDMKETMEYENGLGLAAPQVGVLKRVIVIEVPDSGYIEVINPVIVEESGEQSRTEGCLSVPGKRGKVKRPSFVKVRGLDRTFNDIELTGEGLLAVAFCHEIDHLDGILYTDKATGVEDVPDPDEDYDEE